MKPVSVTYNPDDKWSRDMVCHRCDTVQEAEDWIAEWCEVDPEGVEAGNYGINAPEELINPSFSS